MAVIIDPHYQYNAPAIFQTSKSCNYRDLDFVEVGYISVLQKRVNIMRDQIKESSSDDEISSDNKNNEDEEFQF